MTRFLLPWPDKVLSPNARVHWAKKAKAAKSVRNLVMIDAKITLSKDAGLAARLLADEIPITITFCPPDRRGRDIDNLLASIKPHLDGLAQGLGINDRAFRPTLNLARPCGCACVEVEL